jgi:hypothetical protein
VSPAVELAAWVAGVWLTLAVAVAWAWHRAKRRPRRTAADVMADLAQARRQRDHATCQAIWPDPPSWRAAEAQWRIDTAKQQKEEQ